MSKRNPDEKCLVCGEPTLYKHLCKKHYFQQALKNYRKYEKGKAYEKRHYDYKLAKDNVDRYLNHRLFIFFKFKNNINLKNRFYSIENWKQRLQEMDAIFIDQLIQDYQDSSINLNLFIPTTVKKFEKMDKDLESNNIKKYSRVNNYG